MYKERLRECFFFLKNIRHCFDIVNVLKLYFAPYISREQYSLHHIQVNSTTLHFFCSRSILKLQLFITDLNTFCTKMSVCMQQELATSSHLLNYSTTCSVVQLSIVIFNLMIASTVEAILICGGTHCTEESLSNPLSQIFFSSMTRRTSHS